MSSGQRESASPILIPARTPTASADADASPINCAAPGSGARADAPLSFWRDASSALESWNRGMSAQMTDIERMFV